MNFGHATRFAAAFFLTGICLASAPAVRAAGTNDIAGVAAQAHDEIQASLAPKVPGLAVAVAVDGAIV